MEDYAITNYLSWRDNGKFDIEWVESNIIDVMDILEKHYGDHFIQFFFHMLKVSGCRRKIMEYIIIRKKNPSSWGRSVVLISFENDDYDFFFETPENINFFFESSNQIVLYYSNYQKISKYISDEEIINRFSGLWRVDGLHAVVDEQLYHFIEKIYFPKTCFDFRHFIERFTDPSVALHFAYKFDKLDNTIYFNTYDDIEKLIFIKSLIDLGFTNFKITSCYFFNEKCMSFITNNLLDHMIHCDQILISLNGYELEQYVAKLNSLEINLREIVSLSNLSEKKTIDFFDKILSLNKKITLMHANFASMCHMRVLMRVLENDLIKKINTNTYKVLYTSHNHEYQYRHFDVDVIYDDYYFVKHVMIGRKKAILETLTCIFNDDVDPFDYENILTSKTSFRGLLEN